MLVNPFNFIEKFEWKDLHKKAFQLIHVRANPECLEPFEKVWLYDGKLNNYLIYEHNVLFLTDKELIQKQQKYLNKLATVLKDLRYGVGAKCFCEVSIGNPMMKDHTEPCKKATALLEEIEVKK